MLIFSNKKTAKIEKIKAIIVINGTNIIVFIKSNGIIYSKTI